MSESFENDVKLFMIFDILGDTIRSGLLQWNIQRTTLNSVKTHILDLLLIYRILEKRLPDFLDFKKIFDYIICHDLPEAITSDLTKFEGIPDNEIKRVTELAIDYLGSKFGDALDLKKIITDYDNRIDIESKIVKMIDKFHSAAEFIKYQSERDIDMDDDGILSCLKEIPFVIEMRKEGKDLADIFYYFHMKDIAISDEECSKYAISREAADKIVAVIRGFAGEMYSQKLNNTLFAFEGDFPPEAMKYKRRWR